jgi:hypothetical protein
MNNDPGPLLAELERELKRGHIIEAHLVAEGEHVEGVHQISTGMIVVDPAPSVVDTLLHELLHRRYPRWGERRVSQTANRLVRQMDHATVRKWYRRYLRAAKKASRPISLG